MTRKELKEKFRKILEAHLMLSDDYKDGTYLHHLTRCKSAYGAGTMSLDDFVEVEYDFLEEILGDLMKQFEGFSYGMFIKNGN